LQNALRRGTASSGLLLAGDGCGDELTKCKKMDTVEGRFLPVLVLYRLKIKDLRQCHTGPSRAI
jgi:hypothetical protein